MLDQWLLTKGDWSFFLVPGDIFGSPQSAGVLQGAAVILWEKLGMQQIQLLQRTDSHSYPAPRVSSSVAEQSIRYFVRQRCVATSSHCSQVIVSV